MIADSLCLATLPWCHLETAPTRERWAQPGRPKPLGSWDAHLDSFMTSWATLQNAPGGILVSAREGSPSFQTVSVWLGFRCFGTLCICGNSNWIFFFWVSIFSPQMWIQGFDTQKSLAKMKFSIHLQCDCRWSRSSCPWPAQGILISSTFLDSASRREGHSYTTENVRDHHERQRMINKQTPYKLK